MTEDFVPILQMLAARGGGGYAEVIELATKEPASITPFLLAAAEGLERSGVIVDDLLPHVPEADLQRVADAAVVALVAGRDPDRSVAGALIDGLALQAPATLRSHLPVLWEASADRAYNGVHRPWRAATEHDDIAFLVERLAVPDQRDRAWRCLLEARTREAWAAALDAVGSVEQEQWWTDACCRLVGFEPSLAGEPRLLHDLSVAHLELPDGFLRRRPGRLGHPTWDLGTEVVGEGRFGGTVDASCAWCRGPLHRLVEFDRAPIESELPTAFVTCLSCLGWEVEVLYYDHTRDLAPPDGVATDTVEPQFPVEPLPEAPIRFRSTPPRWALQEWAGNENLHRLGGEGTWVQDAQHPVCPSCRTSMPLALQLDSPEFTDGGSFEWGSGGIGYAFWCRACSISATTWQCT